MNNLGYKKREIFGLKYTLMLYNKSRQDLKEGPPQRSQMKYKV